MEGDVASSLAASVVALENHGAQINTLSKGSELSGFWEPPARQTPGSGILIWVDAEVAYHVAVVHTQDQARSIVRSLADWMNGAHRDRLLSKITLWNIAERSEEPILRIEGKGAELLHWGSVFGRALRQMG